MIDLTPLDVRNKRGDFKKLMRGYDPQEVDVFLELVAERLEGLVRENLQLKERTQALQEQVTSQLGREKAVQDALVTAQELREDMKAQAEREAEHVLREAEAEARRLIAEAEAQVRGKLRGVERRIDGANEGLRELERRRARFLREFRHLLERELEVVQVEEERGPLEERPIDLDLGRSAAEPRDDVVEVTRDVGEAFAEVPGLEEVLSEAGAELAEMPVEPVVPAPQSADEIAPPRVQGAADDSPRLPFDPDET